MSNIIFGKTIQSLINKRCSILIIQEGYTDPNIIPPIIDQYKGTLKIFLIQFCPRGVFIDATIVKTFDDDEPPMLLPAPTIECSKEITSSLISFDPETPQLRSKKIAKKKKKKKKKRAQFQ